MFKKGTKLYSILNTKCPYCHEGDFFEGSAFKGTVKEKCPSCERAYSSEPGFYQGSYYVVYALGVAVFVSTWTILMLFFKELENKYTLGIILGVFFASVPFLYPLSKIIWANLFFSYKGDSTTINERKN